MGSEQPVCPVCGQSVETVVKRHKTLGAWVPVWGAGPCRNPDCAAGAESARSTAPGRPAAPRRSAPRRSTGPGPAAAPGLSTRREASAGREGSAGRDASVGPDPSAGAPLRPGDDGREYPP
ncbi:hypothetical protein ACE1SV_43670 [Streptomyces sp. E-15]